MGRARKLHVTAERQRDDERRRRLDECFTSGTSGWRWQLSLAAQLLITWLSLGMMAYAVLSVVLAFFGVMLWPGQ